MFDFRSVFSSVGKYSLPNLVNMIAGLFVLPVILVRLSPSELGIVSVAEAGSMFFVPLYAMLLDQSVVRFAATFESKARGRYYFHLSVLSTATALLVGSATITAFLVLRDALFPVVPAAILTLSVISASTQAYGRVYQAILRAEERTDEFAIAMTARPVTFAILLSWAVLVLDLGAWGYVLAQVVSFSFSTLLLVFFAARQLSPSFSGFANSIRVSVSFTAPMLPGAMLGNVSNFLDRWILQYFFAPSVIGYYGLAAKFANLFGGLIIGLKGYFQPLFFRHTTEDGRVPESVTRIAKSFVALMLILAALIGLFAGDLISWMGAADYTASIKLVPWVVFAVFVFNLPPFIANGFLHARKTYWSSLASSISVLLFLLGTAISGAYSFALGVGIARLLAALGSTLVLVAVSRKYVDVPVGEMRLGVASLGTILLVVGRDMLPLSLGVGFSILVGTAVILLVVFTMGNPLRIGRQ